MRPIAPILLTLAIAGCAQAADSPAEEAPALVLAHPDRGTGGMDAIVQGFVEVDQDLGCVWLSTPDGARHPVIWPAGTTSGDEPFAVVLPDGRRAEAGDHVSGGGGYGRPGNLGDVPEQCLQTSEVAIFNAEAEIEVTAGSGFHVEETLVDRFPIPEPIGLELIAINPNRRRIAVADLVQGTVHVFDAPFEDAIDGVSGGGGFIHLWSQGSVSTFPGSLDAEPITHRPSAHNDSAGIASTLTVVPSPDDETAWLVQPSVDATLIDVVALVEEQADTVASFELPGRWLPAGATTRGLILNSVDGVLAVDRDGFTLGELDGEAISVGWAGVAVRTPDGGLSVTGPTLDDPVEAERPGEGSWVALGNPQLPTTSPPLATGASQVLVGLAGDGPGPVELVVVGPDGRASVIHTSEAKSPVAVWGRGEDWVAIVEDRSLTLVRPDGSEPTEVGDVLPDDHWLATAG